MRANSWLIIFIFISAFLFFHSSRRVLKTAEPVSVSSLHKYSPHDFPYKLRAVSKRKIRSPLPPRVNFPHHQSDPIYRHRGRKDPPWQSRSAPPRPSSAPPQLPSALPPPPIIP
ncbi:hypothetical protein DITRI_Ditri20bG0039400 [Diplodiscus trichospermus]